MTGIARPGRATAGSAAGVLAFVLAAGAASAQETIPAFQREGLAPFSYATKNGEHKLTSYWRMPDRLYDDTEELARWARDAQAAALRAADKKRGNANAKTVKPVKRPSRRPPQPRGRSRR